MRILIWKPTANAAGSVRPDTSVVSALVSALILVAWPAVGQVAAHQATPDDEKSLAASEGDKVRTEIQSPLFLEVPLQTPAGTNAFRILKLGSVSWHTEATDEFVCDKAHVSTVELTPGRPKKGMIPITVAATFKTDWFRQDIDVVMRLLSPEGKELATRSWDDETIGNDIQIGYGGVTKKLKLEAKVPQADFDRWASSPDPVKLTIHMAIQE